VIDQSAIAELGKRFDDRRGERSKILQLFGDHGVDHIQIQASVFVHGNVAEPDHMLHSGCQIGRSGTSCSAPCWTEPLAIVSSGSG
jgi:hypothetical protein